MSHKLVQKRAATPLISYKYFKAKVDDINVDSRTVSGYFAVFGNKDLSGDIIIKGAFAKSIQERGPGTDNGNKIAFCWQHDIKNPIGRITVLKEDDFGLYFEAIMDTIEEAERALVQLKSGTLNQFSIGFNYIWDKIEYDSDLDAFICKELYLAEGSVVTLACNPMAQFEGMKSADLEDKRIEIRKALEQELKGLSFSKAFVLRQLISDQLSLASVQPSDTLKKELQAGTDIGTSLDFGAIVNSLNN